MKRIISIIMTVAMLFTVLPLSTLALDTSGTGYGVALNIEDSGLKYGQRSLYNLHYRTYGNKIGNVTTAFAVVDSTVFDIGFVHGGEAHPSNLTFSETAQKLNEYHLSFRSVKEGAGPYAVETDGWTDTGSEVTLIGNSYYIRIDGQKKDDKQFTDYSSSSYTAENPSIATVYLLLKDNATVSSDSVRWLAKDELSTFSASGAAVVYNTDKDLYAYNKNETTSGNELGESGAEVNGTVAGVTVTGKPPLSKLSTPTGLKWVGTKATWDSVSNAVKYSVQLYKDNIASGAPAITTTNECDFSSAINVSAGFTFDVTAISDGSYYLDSSVSVRSDKYVYNVPVSGVLLDKDTAEIYVGDQPLTLTAVVSPENAANKSLNWKSDNESVATVDNNGKVSGISNGSAVITVTTVDGGKTDTCSVTVKTHVSEVKLNKSAASLVVGESDTLSVTVLPESASNKSVSWKSGNTAVAMVDNNGKVTAVAVGSTVITVTSADGNKSANCTVTVSAKPVPITGLTFDKTSLTIARGESDVIGVAIAPVDATNRNIIWSSDNESVATVIDGVVSAVGKGTATIKAVSVENSSIFDECTVTVNVPLKKLSLNLASATVVTGESKTLVPVFDPADADDLSVNWKSANESVATVVNGLVDAIGEGSTVITVTSKANPALSATCTITVPHTVHIPDGVYLCDDTHHWQSCTSVGCEEKLGKTAHTETTSASCIAKAYCAVCDNSYGKLAAHVTDTIPFKAADCVTGIPGNIEYRVCRVCNKLFSDTECKVEITLADTVLAPIHTISKVPAKPSTCTEYGNIEYFKCANCDRYYRDIDGNDEITDKTSVDLTELAPHNYSKKSDNTHHWEQCLRCSTEKPGSKQVHFMRNPVWTNDSDLHWHICDSCGNTFDNAAHNYLSGGVICIDCKYIRGVTNDNVNTSIDVGELTSIPSELSGIYSSAEAIEAAIVSQMKQNSINVENNGAPIEISLSYSEDGGSSWNKATDLNLPVGGFEVLVPYPAETGADTHMFAVAAMYTETSGKLNTFAGQIENLVVTETDSGIRLTLRAPAVILISWQSADSDDTAIWSSVIMHNRKFTITATAGIGGTISDEGETKVGYNSRKSYQITPNDGYEIKDVFVNGKSVGAVETYDFRQIKKDQTISATFKKSEPAIPFGDVKIDDPWYSAVKFVYENKLFNGVSDDEFAPTLFMNRAMFATVIGRLAEVDVKAYTKVEFDDVVSGEWYTPYVVWANESGIVKGYGNNLFGINDNITVEQAVVMLSRYAEYIGIDIETDFELESFTDAEAVSEWAESAMKWAVSSGIYEVNGEELTPGADASRALVATMISNFSQKYSG